MSSTAIARFFPYPWLRPAAGTRRRPKNRQASPLWKRARPVSTGLLRRCSILREILGGAESSKAPAKILFSAPRWPEPASADFRDVTIARQARCWRALNIGLVTAPPKVAATTTPQKFRKVHVAQRVPSAIQSRGRRRCRDVDERFQQSEWC